MGVPAGLSYNKVVKMVIKPIYLVENMWYATKVQLYANLEREHLLNRGSSRNLANIMMGITVSSLVLDNA